MIYVPMISKKLDMEEVARYDNLTEEKLQIILEDPEIIDISE